MGRWLQCRVQSTVREYEIASCSLLLGWSMFPGPQQQSRQVTLLLRSEKLGIRMNFSFCAQSTARISLADKDPPIRKVLQHFETWSKNWDRAVHSPNEAALSFVGVPWNVRPSHMYPVLVAHGNWAFFAAARHREKSAQNPLTSIKGKYRCHPLSHARELNKDWTLKWQHEAEAR